MTSNKSSYLAAVGALFLLLVAGPVCAQETRPAPVVSPEIAANGDVSFRVRAPEAESVALTSGGDFAVVPNGGLPLEEGDDGLWQVTIDALAPGAYRYRYAIDGVSTMDPSNPHTSESNGNAWSLVYVPGAEFMDTQNVPHGAVAQVTYYSTALERPRRMTVYTPPGYQRGYGEYPVLYLLHGAMDSDDSWSTVGRAGFILDNLVATGAAVPMVVVMPHGHTGAFSMERGLQLEAFVSDFQSDIKPYIEANYRVRTDRAGTAIAGLSMGGAQTLEIAIQDLAEYAYVGVFSSGVFSIAQDTSWQEKYGDKLGDASLRAGLNLVWFSTGSDDFLIDTSKATVGMLRENGFDVVFEESTGGHTWINWREYLNKFAPQLFRELPE